MVRLLLTLLLLQPLLAAHAHPLPAGQPVATATLVAGPVTRRAADSSEQPLTQGAALYEGDQIETGPGGLIHITFTDQAKIALRPNSQLIIRRYHTQPEHEAIELELPRGTARQITGEAARRAPHRYRLNTPIAAIGVRGTDYAVRALTNTTETLLHQGAIILAPTAFCATFDCPAAIIVTPEQPAWRITADGTAHPIPAADLPQNPDLIAKNGSTSTQSRTQKSAAATTPVVAAALLNETTAAIEPTPPLPSEQLRWGRWFALTPDGLTPERYDELKAAGLVPAVANSRYVLMREAEQQQLIPSAGRIAFQLTEARAQLVRYDWFTDPAQISDAALTIDFAARTYQTAATLAHPQVGSHRLSAAGAITAAGLMGATTPTTQIIGALTPYGTQAGLLYEVRLDPATRLEGITLWRRP